MRVEQGGIIQVLEARVVGRLGIWRNVVDGIKHVAEVGIHSHRLKERLLGSGRLDGHHHGERESGLESTTLGSRQLFIS